MIWRFLLLPAIAFPLVQPATWISNSHRRALKNSPTTQFQQRRQALNRKDSSVHAFLGDSEIAADSWTLRGGGVSQKSFPPLINLIAGIYSGLFGLTLLASPTYFYCANGVLPFYTVDQLTPLETHFARMCGVMYTTFFARVCYAPRSVVTTRLFAIGSTLTLPVWIKIALSFTEDATDSSPFGPKMVWTRTVLSYGVLAAWSIARSFVKNDDQDEATPEQPAKLVNLVASVYAGLAGLTFLTKPAFFYGASGLVPFFTETAEFSPIANACARAFGGTLLALALSSYMMAPGSSVTTRVYATASTLTVPLFIKNLLDKSGTFIKNGNWNKQITTQVVLTAWLWYSYSSGMVVN